MKDEKSAVGFTDFKGYRFTKDSVTHGYCMTLCACVWVRLCTTLLLQVGNEIMQKTAIVVTLMRSKNLSLSLSLPLSLSLSLSLSSLTLISSLAIWTHVL